MLYSGENEGTTAMYNLKYMKVYKFYYRDSCNFFGGKNSIFSHQEADKRKPDPALSTCSFLLTLSLSVPLIIWLRSSSTCRLQYPPKWQLQTGRFLHILKWSPEESYLVVLTEVKSWRKWFLSHKYWKFSQVKKDNTVFWDT